MSVAMGSRSSPGPWPQNTRSWSVGISLRWRWATRPSGDSQSRVFQSVPGRRRSRSLTPMATQARARRAAAPSRSVRGPGISTAASHMRRCSSAAADPKRRAGVGPARARVERHEHLGQGDEARPAGRGLADQVARLGHGGLRVEDDGGRLDDGHAHRGRVAHGRSSRIAAISASTSAVCSPRRGAGRPVRAGVRERRSGGAGDRLGAEGGVVHLHHQADRGGVGVVEQGERLGAHLAVGEPGLAERRQPIDDWAAVSSRAAISSASSRSGGRARAGRRSEGRRGGAPGRWPPAPARAAVGRSRRARSPRRPSRRGGRGRPTKRLKSGSPDPSRMRRCAARAADDSSSEVSTTWPRPLRSRSIRAARMPATMIQGAISVVHRHGHHAPAVRRHEARLGLERDVGAAPPLRARRPRASSAPGGG